MRRLRQSAGRGLVKKIWFREGGELKTGRLKAWEALGLAGVELQVGAAGKVVGEAAGCGKL